MTILLLLFLTSLLLKIKTNNPMLSLLDLKKIVVNHKIPKCRVTDPGS